MSYNPFRNETALLQMLELQKANISQYATEVGALPADVAEIGEDAANLEWIIDFGNLVEDYKKTAFKIKEAFIKGSTNGDPLGAFVSPPNSSPPFPLVDGLEKRARERNQRFKNAKGVSEAAKVALGLVGESPQPDTIKPTIKVNALPAGYKFEVTVRDKQDAQMFTVQIRRMNQEVWRDEKSGTTSPLTVTVTPTTAGQNERLEVRVQLYKKDQPYGESSDPQYVNVNP